MNWLNLPSTSAIKTLRPHVHWPPPPLMTVLFQWQLLCLSVGTGDNTGNVAKHRNGSDLTCETLFYFFVLQLHEQSWQNRRPGLCPHRTGRAASSIPHYWHPRLLLHYQDHHTEVTELILTFEEPREDSCISSVVYWLDIVACWSFCPLAQYKLKFEPALVFFPCHQDCGRGRSEVGAPEVDPLFWKCHLAHLPGFAQRVRPGSGGERNHRKTSFVTVWTRDLKGH